jgi:glucokinase-like ROK family protein
MSIVKNNNGAENEDRTNGVYYKKYLLKKQLIEIFYSDGNKTISEVCDLTNNSVPTITNVIAELADEGWVTNFGIGQSKGGRKPSIYGINAKAGYIVGVDLSRRYTRICAFNLHNEYVGEILETEGLSNSTDILSTLKNGFENVLKANKLKKEQVLGVGVAVPGLIDVKKGVSYSYPQLGDKPLNETFEEIFGRPTFVEHDTRTMALGEQWFGLAKGVNNVLFLNIGSGIGLSMILNGNLYRGKSGFSGEFGHIQMESNGELCYCGKIGCLETIASGTAIVKRAKGIIGNGKNTIISKLTDNNPDKIKLKTIISAANMGDQFAIELLEESGEYLAKGISILIHLFNPDAVIIGGEMAEAGHLIKDPIQQKMSKYTMLLLKQDSQILISELKEKSGLLGILPVVVSNLFFNEPINPKD